jgi:uncharacterized membrane protein HdeD (DUF308 family)
MLMKMNFLGIMGIILAIIIFGCACWHYRKDFKEGTFWEKVGMIIGAVVMFAGYLASFDFFAQLIVFFCSIIVGAFLFSAIFRILDFIKNRQNKLNG